MQGENRNVQLIDISFFLEKITKKHCIFKIPNFINEIPLIFFIFCRKFPKIKDLIVPTRTCYHIIPGFCRQIPTKILNEIFVRFV